MLRHLPLALAFAALAALTPLPLAAQAKFPTDQPAIEARVRALLPDLEKVLGGRITMPAVKVVSASDLAKIIARENAAAMAKMAGGPRGKALERATRAEARAVSKLVFAKVSFDTGTVNVRPAAFRTMAKIGDGAFEKLVSERFMDVVLAHELVHVHQHGRTPLDRFVGTPGSLEALRARFCVLEGHAQYVTRKICEKRGLLPELTLWTKLLKRGGADEKDEAVKMLLDVMSANVAFAYLDGERFFTAVAEKLGYAKAVERVFDAPPATFREISKPDVYLGANANAGPDLDALAKRLAALLPKATYRTRTVSVPMSALRPAMKLGDQKLVDDALTGVISARTIVGTPRKLRVRGEMVTLSLFHTENPKCATTWLALQNNLSRAKDEAMKTGPTRVVSAEYVEDPVGEQSLYVKKMVKSPGLKDPYAVQSLVLSFGAWHVELMAVMTDETKASLIALAKRARAEVEKAAQPTRSAPPK